MSISRENLIRNFVSSMEEGDAALFIGAGMSRPSGFVDWKGLLRECARELNLDLDREHDLVAVAQYYLNLRNRDRSRLNQIISEEFRKPAARSKNHEIIARLPVSTIWTMNFDTLIEDALRSADRIVDVKSRDQDIALHLKDRDAVLYKMHGDINRPDEVIISKDDYERYAKDHYILQHALEGDLISKTFLFLGFSFSDPNLEYMLGHLRSLLEESKREHYAIMRRARLDWRKDKEEAQKLFEYEKNKQQLQINDLQRYSIQSHLIEQFSEVTDILESIEQAHLLKNVFVSGSGINFGELGEERIRDLCMHLGERIVDEDYRLISGVGLNIGDSVVKGTLLKLYERGVTSIEKKLTVRPFPRNLPQGVDEVEFNRNYRESMISKCGFAIFISGNSRTAPEMSRGILEEFSIASKLNKIPIPVGMTGFAARHIWQELEHKIETVYSGRVPQDLFRKLNDPSLTNSEILDSVFGIMRLFRQIGHFSTELQHKAPMDIRIYLRRIGFDQTITPYYETLRSLHAAHMLTVPFENLDISLHRPIFLGELELWNKIVRNQRGGFCYELNGLFALLLRQIGFEVTYLNARVARKDGTFGPDFDHLTLLVKPLGPTGSWLADVGFGDSFIEPLDLETRAEQKQGLRAFRLDETSGTFTVWASDFEGNWRPQYQFDLTPHKFPEEYEAMCMYHQTSPQSSFTRGKLVSQATRDGRITLDDEKLIITRNGQRQEIPHAADEFDKLLKVYFDMVPQRL